MRKAIRRRMGGGVPLRLYRFIWLIIIRPPQCRLLLSKTNVLFHLQLVVLKERMARSSSPVR